MLLSDQVLGFNLHCVMVSNTNHLDKPKLMEWNSNLQPTCLKHSNLAILLHIVKCLVSVKHNDTSIFKAA